LLSSQAFSTTNHKQATEAFSLTYLSRKGCWNTKKRVLTRSQADNPSLEHSVPLTPALATMEIAKCSSALPVLQTGALLASYN
jgi:hypothetical protein